LEPLKIILAAIYGKYQRITARCFPTVSMTVNFFGTFENHCRVERKRNISMTIIAVHRQSMRCITVAGIQKNVVSPYAPKNP
jgi:hypothetical protein